MNTTFYTCITICGLASFIVAIVRMINDTNAPHIFNRGLWVYLSVNIFAAVLLSSGSVAATLFSGIFMMGNIIMFMVSIQKGKKMAIEERQYYSLYALMLATIALIFNAPLLALMLCFMAHFFVYGQTYMKLWHGYNPRIHAEYWGLLFGASLLSIIAADSVSLVAIIFPLYVAVCSGYLSYLIVREKYGDRKLFSKPATALKASLSYQ